MKGARELRKRNLKEIGSNRKKRKGRIGSRRKIRKGNLKGIRSRRMKKQRADKLAAQEKDREIELARIAMQEKNREIELARITTEDAKTAADERLEMARIEGIAQQAERDTELKRTELETDRESKLSSKIELKRLKHSFKMKL